jgi:hypothetical protein
MRNIRTLLAAWVAASLMLGGLVGAWAVGSASAAPDRTPAPSAPVSLEDDDDDDDDDGDDDDGEAPVGGVDTGGGGLAR